MGQKDTICTVYAHARDSQAHNLRRSERATAVANLFPTVAGGRTGWRQEPEIHVPSQPESWLTLGLTWTSLSSLTSPLACRCFPPPSPTSLLVAVFCLPFFPPHIIQLSALGRASHPFSGALSRLEEPPLCGWLVPHPLLRADRSDRRIEAPFALAKPPLVLLRRASLSSHRLRAEA